MNLWSNPKIRTVVYQVATVILLLWLAYAAVINTQSNLAARGIDLGISFLYSTAGFDISQTLLSYNESSTYLDAFFIGLANTLVVSFIGIVFATLLGFTIGIMRLSKNWLLAKVATVYVETFRNIPLLLQIIFWYEVVLKPLPDPKEMFQEGQKVLFSLNNRGLYLPHLEWDSASLWFFITLIAGVITTVLIHFRLKTLQKNTGQIRTLWPYAMGLMIGLPIMVFLALGSPLTLHPSQMGAFELGGGSIIIPEFMALLIALSIYTAAFIAENVRSGLNAVSKGQTEASASLGMPNNVSLRLVVIPQALRVIIPPLTNQYLNLIKNSSLAAAIAYPDLVAVFAGTALNQSGRVLEIMSITLAVYLLISLITSLFMNWFNQRVALVSR